MRFGILGACLAALVLSCPSAALSQEVKVQTDRSTASEARNAARDGNWQRGGWRRDHDDYWNGYWNWYDGSYRPYYQQTYRYPNNYYGQPYGYDGYYGRSYNNYGGRYYGTPNAGYFDRRGGGGTVRVGPLQFGWR
jgi:hypothetical protein